VKEPKLEKLNRLHHYYSRYFRSQESLKVDLSNINHKLSSIEKAKLDAKGQPDQLARLEQQASELEQQRAALRERDTELSLRIKSAIAVRTAAEEWLKTHGIPIPGETAPAVHRPFVDIDEQSAQTLESLRAKIAELKSQARMVEEAWPPAKMLIAEKHAQIDRLLDPICQPGVDISRRRGAS